MGLRDVGRPIGQVVKIAVENRAVFLIGDFGGFRMAKVPVLSCLGLVLMSRNERAIASWAAPTWNALRYRLRLCSRRNSTPWMQASLFP